MKPVPTICNPVPNDRFRMTRAGAVREVDGRCRRNTSRFEALCSKAFAGKTGGWEVGFAENALVIRELKFRKLHFPRA